MANDITYLQQINDADDVPQPTQIRKAQFVDADGNPVGGPSSAPSTPAEPADGSISPAKLAGYSADTGHGRIPKVKGDGTGFDFVDVPVSPTADTLTGATDTGRALLKAKDAAGARTAIGAGTSSFSGSYADLTNKPAIPAAYTLPAASAALGGVRQAAYVADPAGDTVTKAEFIALRDALVASGAMSAKG